MSEWKTYKLGEISEIIARGVSPKYADTGVPVINQKCVRDGKIKFNDIKFNDINLKKISDEKYLLKNDILINSTGQGTLGRVGQINFEISEFTYDSHVTLVRVQKSFDQVFIGYKLKSLQPYIESMAEGSTGQTELNREKLRQLEITVPDFTTQTQIAQILTSLDDKIELNLQMNQTLEAMAQAIFKEWFVDFKFPGFDGELVDGLPKGWKKSQIKEICEVNSSTLSSKEKIDEIHYVEISEVDKGIIKEIKIYKRGEEPSRARRKLKHGDTVLSTVRPNRGSYFLSLNPTVNLIASTGFAVFTPTSVPFSFLYLFLTNEEQLEFYGKMADGAAYPAINPSVIMNMEINLPSNEILEMFHNITGNIFIKALNNFAENKILLETRDTLLPRLMSGKISLNL